MLKDMKPTEDVVYKWYFQRNECLAPKIPKPRKEGDLSQATAEVCGKVRCKTQTSWSSAK